MTHPSQFIDGALSIYRNIKNLDYFIEKIIFGIFGTLEKNA